MFSQCGSIQLKTQLVKIEPVWSDLSDNQDHLAGCPNENISQTIKTEPCFQDKDEELFSLVHLAKHLQSSSLPQCTHDDKHTTFLDRNGDLTPHRENQKSLKPYNSDQFTKSSISITNHKRSETVANSYGFSPVV